MLAGQIDARQRREKARAQHPVDDPPREAASPGVVGVDVDRGETSPVMARNASIISGVTVTVNSSVRPGVISASV